MPADARAIIRIQPETAEEGPTAASTASERALVDVQVIADRVDGDDGRVRRTGVEVVGREGRHRPDVAEADDGQTGLVAGEGEAAADITIREVQAGARIHRDGARAERSVRRGRQRRGGSRTVCDAGQDTDVDGDRTGHRVAAGKEGDVTRSELFQRPCPADRSLEDQRVRVDVHPGILRERGRPRENMPLIDGEHRRIRRTP